MTEFLRDLWRGKPEDSAILIWSGSSKHSAFFLDVEDAITYAQRRAQQDDVYVGAGLRAKGSPPDKRGGNEDVIGVGGLWLDVDIADPVHKKTNLFSDQDKAIEFVSTTTPLQPSYVIHSGHGLQVWWLFNEVVMFDTPAERKSMSDLSRRWVGTFRAKAQELGLDIDALHDLARVMRIPGTFNRKSDVKPVQIVQISSLVSPLRYSPQDFEPYLVELASASADEIIDVGDFVINMTAEPNFTKFELLSDNSAKFRLSWAHKRRDMADATLSAYDQSLASLAARAGWPAQEIVNLLISHRRRYDGLGGNHNWPDYFKRTVKLAMSGVDAASARQSVIITEIEDLESTEDKIAALSRLLNGIQVTAIIKFLSDPPSYRLRTEAGDVNLGTINNLLSQPLFTQHLANATRQILPKMKNDKWEHVAQIMLDLLVEESAGLESTDNGMVHGWLTAYLADHKPTPSLEDAFRTLSTFIDDEGHVFVFGQALRRFLLISYGDRIDTKQLGALLRAFGCLPVEKSFPSASGKGRVTRHCWSLPLDQLF